MEDEAIHHIEGFIRDFLNIKKRKITPETSLSELGLDGDDVLDFLLSFFKKFSIDHEDTDYLKYVPNESGFLLSTLKSIFTRRRTSGNAETEITVKDLINSIKLKRWQKVENVV